MRKRIPEDKRGVHAVVTRTRVLLAVADHAGGGAHGDGIVGYRPGDHRASPDDAMFPNIGHDGCVFADPAIAADGYPTPRTRLFADGNVEPINTVLSAPVGDRDMGTDEHVVLEGHVTNAAEESHVHVLPDLRGRVRED